MTKKLEIFMTTSGPNGREVEFSLDEKNKLHIDGEEVATREVVQLRWIELLALCLTAGAVVAQAIFAGLTYFKS